jgi:hypothetical protein
LRWLDQQNLNLATVRQNHIDHWLTTGRAESTYAQTDWTAYLAARTRRNS